MRPKPVSSRLLKAVFSLLVSTLALAFPSAEMERAEHYLTTKNEVYFSFKVNDRAEIDQIGQVVIIDKVVGETVFAYATSQSFPEFLKRYSEFQVLPHDEEIPVEDAFDVGEISSQMGRGGGIDKFPSYSAYEAMMKEYPNKYSDLCTYLEFGSTSRHKLLGSIITSKKLQTGKKPRILLTGTVHGDEYVGFGICLNMIDYLLVNYGKDAKVTELLDKAEIFVTPLANPDGCYRSNNNAPSGSTRGNGSGADINRSFPNPAGSPGASEQVETRAFVDLMKKNQFTLAMDMHAGTQEMVYPWGVWKAQQKKTADHAWWNYVCKNYTKTAGYFTLIEIGWQMYEAPGERMNYSLYYHSCRDITTELSNTKGISSSQIQNYWNKNRDAVLQYCQEALFGINGTVTDASTGKPIAAKVFVTKHDVDNSWVNSFASTGCFFRPINAGTYNLEITAPGYAKQTLSNVAVKNGQATTVDIKLKAGYELGR